jgi:subtilisin family serine protease
MNRKYICIVLCLSISYCLSLQAQQTSFYYSRGKKINLEIDYSRISVVSEVNVSSEKVKNLISNSDFIITNRVKSIFKESISNDKHETLKQDKEIIASEIVFPDKKNAKEYYDLIQNIQKEQSVVKASPTYLENNKKLGISNNFLVKIKKAIDIDILDSLVKRYALKILERNEYMPQWFTLSCTKECPFNAVEAANFFYETKLFESALPEFIFEVTMHSNDPYFNDQWGLKNIGQYGGTPGVDMNIEAAWTQTTGSPNIRVAVFDSGIDMNHPDLIDNVDQDLWIDLTNPDANKYLTYNYHGTCVAGAIGAKKDNNIGISGVSPGSKLISIKFDKWSVSVTQLAKGFIWAIDNGIDVISCSWGLSPTGTEELDEAIDSALTYGRGGRGCVVVFSVGNDNSLGIAYPANSDPRIIAVGAISPCGDLKSPYSCDSMTWGSNYGSQLDVVAPGVLITTTDQIHAFFAGKDNYNDKEGINDHFNTLYYNHTIHSQIWDYPDKAYTKFFYGTSASCPYVAGIAALILSKDSNLTVQQVGDAIERSATKLSSSTYEMTNGHPNGTWDCFTGYGLVNAYAALIDASNLTTQEIDGLEVSIFPAPFKDVINFRSENSVIRIINIYDLNGRCVLSRSVADNACTLNTDLAKGIYLCKIVTTKGVEYHKLISTGG